MTDFCRSRRNGALCTRAAGHRGLHQHDSLLWTDAGADPPQCPAAGEPATAAAVLDDGFPFGRALCPRCLAFVPLDGGRLAVHDSWAGEATEQDAARRREWFNTHGW